jgi:hypothetical protein
VTAHGNGHDGGPDRGPDRELRDLFAAARTADRRRAPGFADTVGAARQRAEVPGRRRVVVRAAWAVSVSAVAVAVALVIVRPGGAGRPAFTPDDLAMAHALSAWTTPTDGLAAFSGVKILDSVPGLSMTSVPLPEWSGPAAAAGRGSASDDSAGDEYRGVSR